MDCNYVFSSEPQNPDERMVDGRNANSCPVSVPQFRYVVLFNWCDSVVKPFQVYPRETFADEIKDRCLEQDLTYQLRMKRLIPLKALPGERMSLFAVMEGSKY